MAGSVIPMKADRAEGKRQALNLGIAGLKGNGKRCATLGDVCSAGDGQPVGHAVLGELAQVDGGVHLVDTGNDRGGIEQADDKRNRCRRAGSAGPESRPRMAFSAQTKMGPTATSVTSTVTNTETSGVTKRSNISGTILCRRFSRKARIAQAMTMGDHGPDSRPTQKAVDAGDDGDHGLHALGGNRVGALQRGVDERTTDDGTQIRVGAKGLSGGVTDQDLQNAKRRARPGRQSYK